MGAQTQSLGLILELVKILSGLLYPFLFCSRGELWTSQAKNLHVTYGNPPNLHIWAMKRHKRQLSTCTVDSWNFSLSLHHSSDSLQSLLFPTPMINISLKSHWGTFLVVQWIRNCLPMQGTWVWSPVGEDPTCCGPTKPVCHNYWARVLQLLKATCSRAHALQ